MGCATGSAPPPSGAPAAASASSDGEGDPPEPEQAAPITPPLRPATSATVREAVRASGARAVLVNVWSTWCTPCVEEMPDLLSLRHELRPRGFDLILVSADFESNEGEAHAFLQSVGVEFVTYRKTEPDMEFIDGLSPKWSGTLPVSLLYDRSGALVEMFEGRVNPERLRARIEAVLAPKSPRL
jgi:thiol-disulfide isomerase/thioredoxin